MKALIRARSLAVLAAAILGSLLSAKPAQAMRFVEFRVYLDGQFILLATNGDHGDKSKDAVWDYLKSQPLRNPDATDRQRDRRRPLPKGASLPEPFVIKADADNPLRATIQGKIKIFSPYSYTIETSRLQLVRKSEADSVWRIAPEEVDRLHDLRAKEAPER